MITRINGPTRSFSFFLYQRSSAAAASFIFKLTLGNREILSPRRTVGVQNFKCSYTEKGRTNNAKKPRGFADSGTTRGMPVNDPSPDVVVVGDNNDDGSGGERNARAVHFT